ERFYGAWFGMRVARRSERLTLFLTDGGGFDLALMEDAAPQKMPGWFHRGFPLDTSDAAIRLHARMLAEGMPMARPLCQDQSLVSFRCADPDGYAIEIYWEPRPAPAQ